MRRIQGERYVSEGGAFLTVLGVVTGLSFEAAVVARGARDAGVADRILVKAGLGRAEARRAAEALIAEGATALLSFGIAGGLAPAALCGAAVVANTVAGENTLGCSAVWSDRLCAGFGIELRGTLAQTSRIIGRSSEKAALFSATGALAADMESYGVGEAAQAAGLPFAVLRVIADTAGDDLPDIALGAMAADGSLKVRETFGRILQNPAQIPGLVRLGRATGRARKRLRALAALGARDLFFMQG